MPCTCPLQHTWVWTSSRLRFAEAGRETCKRAVCPWGEYKSWKSRIDLRLKAIRQNRKHWGSYCIYAAIFELLAPLSQPPLLKAISQIFNYWNCLITLKYQLFQTLWSLSSYCMHCSYWSLTLIVYSKSYLSWVSCFWASSLAFFSASSCNLTYLFSISWRWKSFKSFSRCMFKVTFSAFVWSCSLAFTSSCLWSFPIKFLYSAFLSRCWCNSWSLSASILVKFSTSVWTSCICVVFWNLLEWMIDGSST